jgi:predicted nucleic acid-binding protein
MRYLLDTNIISNVVRMEPSPALLTWLEAQVDEDLYLASLTSPRSKRGIVEKPKGRKRAALDAWFIGPEGPQALFAGRILSFDERAALRWADLMADGKKRGRPRSALDMIIAAIAQTNDCIVVTDNESDFAEIEVMNPPEVRSRSPPITQSCHASPPQARTARRQVVARFPVAAAAS